MAHSATNLKTKVYLVTGATGAIGKAIARRLAQSPDSKVVLLCRDRQKAERAVNEIIKQTGNPAVSYELADVGRHDDIHALVNRWVEPLHGLINNAACTPRTREETPEGIESQFATNVLGYYWLTQAFEKILMASAPARVVNVASYWAGELDLGDLEFKHRRYQNGTAYRQSKQANRMLTVASAEKLQPHGVTVNACHPGDVNSVLSNNLGFGGYESPDEGADTPVWLATDRTGQECTGLYFEHRQQTRCHFSQNRQAIQALYELCANYSCCASSGKSYYLQLV